MNKAKNGDTVKVHYTGKLEDGSVFGTSDKSDPVQFKIGEGQVLKGFENAVIGMNPGESKTAKIDAEEAYGHRRNELVFKAGRNDLPDNVEPKVGQKFQVVQPDNQKMTATVIHVEESSVTLDANHPLAGEDLTFNIQLVEII